MPHPKPQQPASAATSAAKITAQLNNSSQVSKGASGTVPAAKTPAAPLWIWNANEKERLEFSILLKFWQQKIMPDNAGYVSFLHSTALDLDRPVWKTRAPNQSVTPLPLSVANVIQETKTNASSIVIKKRLNALMHYFKHEVSAVQKPDLDLLNEFLFNANQRSYFIELRLAIEAFTNYFRLLNFSLESEAIISSTPKQFFITNKLYIHDYGSSKVKAAENASTLAVVTLNHSLDLQSDGSIQRNITGIKIEAFDEKANDIFPNQRVFFLNKPKEAWRYTHAIKAQPTTQLLSSRPTSKESWGTHLINTASYQIKILGKEFPLSAINSIKNDKDLIALEIPIKNAAKISAILPIIIQKLTKIEEAINSKILSFLEKAIEKTATLEEEEDFNNFLHTLENLPTSSLQFYIDFIDTFFKIEWPDRENNPLTNVITSLTKNFKILKEKWSTIKQLGGAQQIHSLKYELPTQKCFWNSSIEEIQKIKNVLQTKIETCEQLTSNLTAQYTRLTQEKLNNSFKKFTHETLKSAVYPIGQNTIGAAFNAVPLLDLSLFREGADPNDARWKLLKQSLPSLEEMEIVKADIRYEIEHSSINSYGISFKEVVYIYGVKYKNSNEEIFSHNGEPIGAIVLTRDIFLSNWANPATTPPTDNIVNIEYRNFDTPLTSSKKRMDLLDDMGAQPHLFNPNSKDFILTHTQLINEETGQKIETLFTKEYEMMREKHPIQEPTWGMIIEQKLAAFFRPIKALFLFIFARCFGYNSSEKDKPARVEEDAVIDLQPPTLSTSTKSDSSSIKNKNVTAVMKEEPTAKNLTLHRVSSDERKTEIARHIVHQRHERAATATFYKPGSGKNATMDLVGTDVEGLENSQEVSYTSQTFVPGSVSKT